MRKRISILILVLSMLSVLASCNSGVTTGTNKATTKATTTAAPTTTAATTPKAAEYPDYLNLDATYPIFKTGQAVRLTMAIPRNSATSDWDKLWVSKYLTKYYNMDLVVEQIPDAGVVERVNLMFASGNLPDIMVNMGVVLDGSALVKYGVLDNQLLKLDQYIDEKLTPDIIRRFNDTPTSKALATAPDGHMYSLPKTFETMDGTSLQRLNINSAWLKTVGLQNPRTLNELTTVLRAFKTMDPAGVGSDNVVPLGGGVKVNHPGYYILNALGYVVIQNGGNGTLPAIKNGEVVMPCGDQGFLEYLTTMNTYYKDGLISKKFFVMDNTELTGQMVSNYVGIYPGNRTDVTGITNWTDWESTYALTSDSNPTAVWPTPVAATTGGFVVSAKTKYPEACLRFANAFFSIDSRIVWIGPPDGSEIAMGYLGRKVDASDASVSSKTFDTSKFPTGIKDNWSYVMGYISPSFSFGSIDMYDSINYYHVTYHGGKSIAVQTLNPTFADHYFRLSAIDHVLPSISATFPNIYYLDENENTKLADLDAVIKPYVEEQVARFISGDRPLSEFNAYLAELKTIGISELETIYKNIWKNFLASAK